MVELSDVPPKAMAYTVVFLLIHDDSTDETAGVGLADVRSELRVRLSAHCADVLASLEEPEPTPEVIPGAVKQFADVFAADERLRSEVADALASAGSLKPPVGTTVTYAKAYGLRQDGRREEALAVYDEYLQRSPDEPYVLVQSAQVLRELGRPADAASRLHRALSYVADDVATEILIVIELIELGERATAVAVADAAASLIADDAEPAAFMIDLAQAWTALDAPERALAAIRPIATSEQVSAGLAAAAIEPSAHALGAMGAPAKPEEIIGWLESRGVPLADAPVFQSWLGNILLRLGRLEEALALFDAGLADRVPAAWHGVSLLGRGEALLATGDPAAAEPVLRSAAARLEGDLAAQAGLGQALAMLSQDRGPEASALLDQLAASTATSGDRILRGRIALYQAAASTENVGQREKSLHSAEELLPMAGPERSLLAFLLAGVLARRQPDRAVELLDSISTSNPAWKVDMLSTRAAAEAARGRPEAALDALDPLLEDLESLPKRQRLAVTIQRAELLLQLGRPGMAADGLTQVADLINTDEGLALAYLNMCVLTAEALGTPDLLTEALGRTARQSPALAPLVGFLEANTLVLMGGEAAGFTKLRELEDPKDESNPWAWLVAGMARQIFDRPNASEALDRAIALEPRLESHPFARQARALAAAGRGDLVGIEEFRTQACTPAERTLAAFMCAGALVRAGRVPEAIAQLDQLDAESQEATSGPALILRAQALALKAILLAGRDDVAGAESALRSAEALAAALPGQGITQTAVALARAVRHMKLNQHEEADAALAMAARSAGLDNLEFQIDYLRGVNWQLSGPTAAYDAWHWLTAAEDRRPDDVDTLTALGQVNSVLEDHAKAREKFGHALAMTVDARERAALRRDIAAAERKLGDAEAAVETARCAVGEGADDARNWLSLGAAQLDLHRLDAAEIAFRRGWRMRPPPPDPVATQLLLGLTKALVDGDRADDACALLQEPRARVLADREKLIEFNRAVALLRLHKQDQAIAALRKAERSELADRLASSVSPHDSWLGFWFGAGMRWSRRLLGGLLVLLTLLALLPVLVDATRAPWLSWAATDNTRLLAPLVVVVVLFLLPITQRIKIGDFEVEQPAAAAPEVVDLNAVSWDAIERKAIVSPTRIGASVTPGPPAITQSGDGILPLAGTY